MIRGGSFANDAANARSAYRNGNHPSNRWNDVGFRPASSSQREIGALGWTTSPPTAPQGT